MYEFLNPQKNPLIYWNCFSDFFWVNNPSGQTLRALPVPIGRPAEWLLVQSLDSKVYRRGLLLLLRSRERASRDRPQERIIGSELRPWPDRRNKLSRLMPLLDFVGRKTQQGHPSTSNRQNGSKKVEKNLSQLKWKLNAFDVCAFTIIWFASFSRSLMIAPLPTNRTLNACTVCVKLKI